LSGAITGLAGVLLANIQMFATPMDLSWQRSGDYIVMVILGGGATVAGPVLGALFFELAKHVLENWTTHWELYFGPLLVAYVLCPSVDLKRFFKGRPRPVASGKASPSMGSQS
jgi:branched-chain amino acid transport system permease protein